MEVSYKQQNKYTGNSDGTNLCDQSQRLIHNSVWFISLKTALLHWIMRGLVYNKYSAWNIGKYFDHITGAMSKMLHSVC